jgi:hypothetical protein
VGIVSAELGHFDGESWRVDRYLNGDETHQGRHIRIPAGSYGMQRVKLYRYR